MVTTSTGTLVLCARTVKQLATFVATFAIFRLTPARQDIAVDRKQLRVPELCWQSRILPYNASRDEGHHEAGGGHGLQVALAKTNDPEKYEATLEFANRYARFWDEPKADVG